MKTLALICLCLFAVPGWAAFDQTYADLDAILQNVVVYNGNQSQVDYKKLQKMPIQMNRYLKLMGRLSHKQYDGFTQKEKEAFWINAYNGFALKLLEDFYPKKNLKQITGKAGGALDLKFVRAAGQALSLNDIEEKYLTKLGNYKVHFAINPGVVHAPRLRNEVYLPEKLDAQLDDQIETFLKDTTKNRLDTEKKTFFLSEMMKKVEADLKAENKTLIDFASPYMLASFPESEQKKIKDEISKGVYKVEFVPYDWSLNNRKD